MNYFYFYPFNRQYFFPEDVFEHPFLFSIYTPYSTKAKIFWFLFKHISLVRKTVKINASKLPKNIIRLQELLQNRGRMVFNLGTPGIEQKITALGYDSSQDTKFFVKYAEKNQAKRLVRNEYMVLNTLGESLELPKILSYEETKDGLMIKTSFLNGNKVRNSSINKRIFKFILRIPKAITDESKLNKITYKNLELAFAHGDLCPWNLLEFKGKIRAIDWEMAGMYPVGYDIFTFIFQTSFLLHPNLTPIRILEAHLDTIEEFFLEMGIKNWKEYLLAFATIKQEKEKKKESTLFKKYSELIEICNATF